MSSEKLKALKAQFENAIQRLQEGVEIKKTVWTRDASIQRFEFTFELAWKVMKLYIEEQGGKRLNFPKETMQEAFRRGLLENEPLWLESIRYRNLTSHTYQEKVAQEIYQALPKILKLYQKLLAKLKLD